MQPRLSAVPQIDTIWGNYLRISEDPNDLGKGVNRQSEDTSDAVARRGSTISKTYRENDTSAYKKRKLKRRDDQGNTYYVYRVIRPVWQQALADLRNGTIDALMVWDIDRLARDPRDLEDAIELVEWYGKRIEGATGSIDLMTDSGRAMARVMVAMANKSSADTGRRVARAHLDMAKTGQTVGGRRTFGWSPEDRTKLDPIEKELVRSAVEQLIAGETTLHGIAVRWNALGVKTVMGNMWTQNKVRGLLTNPRMAGKRVHMGIEYDGAWEPMIDDETWEKLRIFFTGSRRGRRVAHEGGRKYMLAGMVRCGTCGHRMYGNKFQDRHNYVCRGTETGFDHGVAVNGARLDELVREAVVRTMSDTIIPTTDGGFTGDERLIEIQDEKADALGRMRAKTLSAKAAMVMVEILEVEERELADERTTWLRRASGPSVKRVTQAAMEAMAVEEQRDLIGAWLKYVVVQPPATRSRHWDRSRLELVWQE
jgi:site-specific DNA recombinase